MSSRFCSSRITLSQGQIFWQEIGEGQTLVFLHGSWYDRNQWRPVVERLSGNYHCLTPDLPGFGDSKFVNIHYSITLLVDYLAEYLEALKLPRVYLVGHSLGGWIAASYALKYADKVKGLVLIEPEGVKVPHFRGRWRWPKFLVGVMPIGFWFLKMVYPLAKLLGRPTKIQQQLQFREQLLKSPGGCQILFQRRDSEIQAELLDEKLSGLQRNVLILCGAEDVAAKLALSQSYGALCPISELLAIPSGGDNLPQQMPGILAEQIRNFVDKK